MKKKQSHFLSGLIYLDVINLENKLNDSLKTSNTLFLDSIFFDLSQCRFAELGALTKLLLIVESYLKNGEVIYFALPTSRLTIKESNSRDYKESTKSGNLNRRKKTTDFLKVCGFVTALQEIGTLYNNEIFITEDYDFNKLGLNEDSFYESFSIIYDKHSIEDFGYKYIFPFQWIDCSNGFEEVKYFENKLNKILENSDRGLDSMDVKAIRNVILSELIKNVNEHSHSKYAVLSIGLINSYSLFKEHLYKKINKIEKEYITWIKKNKFTSQVEIYFGDSGKGILNADYKKYINSEKSKTLSDNNQLELAFQKWTSLKNDELRRGTKGLYRIQKNCK